MMPMKYKPSALRSPPFVGSSSRFLPNSVSPCEDEKFSDTYRRDGGREGSNRRPSDKQDSGTTMLH